ncbi:L-threonylcarbamoyladenylate synthase [Hasllibacter sp. MH4015]|uniref:L-threonylcarbamoyladenylate synthase n=1 Tax=Hasllibacter sp. MH4015 TaxID=2854029 RepID=UPI001CD297ED|nr:L-threonylcarbamoyladenylate synthase [Hasllibacter sp. MH4015]
MLHDDVHSVARAVALLSAGGLVAMPTETVYGLAADARNPRAVARVFEAKGRPTFNPLIVHVPDMEAVAEIAEVSPLARQLADAFWPGALTLVLPSLGTVADLVTGGLSTIAVRIPAHDLSQRLLRAFDGPLAAPSANPSGQISPTRAAHVAAGLGGQVNAILDGGPCAVGLESTILAPSPDGVRLLREGGIPRERVEALLGTPLIADLTPGRVEAPGQMERHYAPATRLVMADTPRPNAVVIGFGDHIGDLNLSAAGDLVEAAANLFATLHAADALAKGQGKSLICVAPIPDTGLGRAINDRLRRAAAPQA